MIHPRFFAVCLVVSSAVGSACTVVVDSERVQCVTDRDCAARGPEFEDSICEDSLCQPNPTWACLDEPGSVELLSDMIHVNLTLSDLLTQKPMSGVRLTLCSKIDAECQVPIGHYESDSEGKLDVEMPTGFDGYLQTEGEGIYPTMFFPSDTNKQRAPSVLPMVPNTFVGAMFGRLGASVADDRSIIMTTALNCLGKPASGIVLESNQSDAETVTFYGEEGLPSGTATATDEQGVGGFVNVKPGATLITTTVAETGRLAGRVAVQTRPGHLTMVMVVPNGG